MCFKHDALDLAEQSVSHAIGGTQRLDELLRKVARARIIRCVPGGCAIETTLYGFAVAPTERGARAAEMFARTGEKGLAIELFSGCVAPMRQDVGQGRLARAACADDGNEAWIKREVRRNRPRRACDRDAGDRLGRACTAWRHFSYIRPAGGFDTRLPQ